MGILICGLAFFSSPSQGPGTVPLLEGSNAPGSGNSKGPTSAKSSPTMAHFKVVFWFDGTSWKSQAYDLRRAEYTKAVEDWVNRAEFDSLGFARPGRMTIVREVALPESPVETQGQRLAAEIREELQRTLRGVDRAKRVSEFQETSPRPGDRPGGAMSFVRPRARPVKTPTRPPGWSGVRPGPLPMPSPFPYPYPRPHP